MDYRSSKDVRRKLPVPVPRSRVRCRVWPIQCTLDSSFKVSRWFTAGDFLPCIKTAVSHGARCGSEPHSNGDDCGATRRGHEALHAQPLSLWAGLQLIPNTRRNSSGICDGMQYFAKTPVQVSGNSSKLLPLSSCAAE